MFFKLNIDVLQLGLHSDMDQLLFPVESWNIRPEVRLLNDTHLSCYEFDERRNNCLSNVNWNENAVFVLLPELDTDDISLSREFLRVLELVPELQSHQNVYLFPYGRSSLQLALRQAESGFSKNQFDSVQIFSYDRSSRLDIGSPTVGTSAGVASECAIVATVSSAKRGLKFSWSSYERHTSDKTEAFTVAELLSRYNKQKGLLLSQCYFPLCIEETAKEAWLTSLCNLGFCISNETEILFLDMYTGDLGACSGLFSLCHMQKQYQEGRYKGRTLQLDISHGQYRSVMMLEYRA
ncbi:hypothetical protein [Vibrio atypicus]|uniref:hypothetical protein n=1 Tax=Vibrio atypicus TaxID=558271 RepID=UPI003736917E